jgi:hypothetical protein
MRLHDVQRILQQALELGTIESIYFEGGEPFLYYGLLVQAVQMAARLGFQVGIVSNAYWATSVEDALEWLRPFAGLVRDLSISSDLYHWSEPVCRQAQNAREAAEQLGIPIGLISIAQPDTTHASSKAGQIPVGQSAVMYRGRAAERLIAKAARRRWVEFTECPYEDLREPGRIHVDPFGNLHICQGIALGNVFYTPLRQICETCDPDTNPIIGPLLEGGPARLATLYSVPHDTHYADACHFCYTIRCVLRERFADILMPEQMYGVPAGDPMPAHL